MGSRAFEGETAADQQAQRPESVLPASATQHLLALQRTAGNHAVARMLAPAASRLDRFAVTTDYSLVLPVAPVGATQESHIAFQSQGLRHRTGKYYQIKTRLLKGGELVKSREEFEFDPATQTGKWEEPRPRQFVGRPPVKVSQNGRLAIEQTSQAKVFFVDASDIAGINTKLANKGSAVRIRATGLTMTFPHGVAGRPGSFSLTQVSAVAEKAGGAAVTKLEDLHVETLQLATECHAIATVIAGEGDPTALGPAAATGTDAAANPRPGQIYHFKAQSPAEKLAGGTNYTYTEVPLDPKAKGITFPSVMKELETIDEQLARIDEGFTLAQALANLPPGLSSQAKAYLPGWGSHSEAVIAADGADALTMVNYNRDTEASWVYSRVFREMYRQFEKIQKHFKTTVKREVHELQGKAQVAAHHTSYVVATLEAMSALITELAPEQGKMLADLKEAQKTGTSMWYFDLY